LSALCRICGGQGILPRSIKIPLRYDEADAPQYHGGYSEVWKGEYLGREIAIKVLKVYQTSNFKKITRVSYRLFDRVGELTVALLEVLQGSFDVEGVVPSKRAPAAWGYNGRLSICNGIGLDGKRKY
jgi:hypothetical protein